MIYFENDSVGVVAHEIEPLASDSMKDIEEPLKGRRDEDRYTKEVKSKYMGRLPIQSDDMPNVHLNYSFAALSNQQNLDEMNKKDYLGFHDWRIPEREEIEKIFMADSTILARSNNEIHLDPLFAPGGGNASWCLPFDQQAAFYFSYTSGNAQQFDQDYSQGYVRLVRLYPDD